MKQKSLSNIIINIKSKSDGRGWLVLYKYGIFNNLFAAAIYDVNCFKLIHKYNISSEEYDIIQKSGEVDEFIFEPP